MIARMPSQPCSIIGSAEQSSNTHKAQAPEPVCLSTDTEILMPGEEDPEIRRLEVGCRDVPTLEGFDVFFWFANPLNSAIVIEQHFVKVLENERVSITANPTAWWHRFQLLND